MNVPKLAIERRRLTLMLFLLLFILGVRAFVNISRQEDPTLTYSGVLVRAIYPGTAPEDIEALVLDPIEEAANEMEDIERISSYAYDGYCFSLVKFQFGVNIDEKIDELRSKINALRTTLPDDIYAVEVDKVNLSDVAMFQFALVSETATFAQLEAAGEKLKDELNMVTGVKRVELEAYAEQQVRVALRAARMTHMNVSVDDIAKAIQSNNANIPAGTLHFGRRQFNVKTSGFYGSLEDIRNTVVGAHEGRNVLLRHAAEVRMDYADPTYLAHFNGQRCIFVSVIKQKDRNIFEVAEPVWQKAQSIEFKHGISLQVAFDQADGVRSRINQFLGNLTQGIVLVGIIILFALGARAAGLAMLAVPFSMFIGVWVLYLTDHALQQASIAGLVIALGLLVDNNIVVLENIGRMIRLGKSRKQAAIDGVHELTGALTSATLTTCLAFIPIIMMPDEAGEFIESVPISVVATLLGSLLIALTLTPLLATKVLKESEPRDRFFVRQMDRFLEGPFKRSQNFVFSHQRLVLLLALLLVGSVWGVYQIIGTSLFPPADKPQFRVLVRVPETGNLDATRDAVREVEAILAEYDRVKSYASNMGKANPRVYYNQVVRRQLPYLGEIFVIVEDQDYDTFAAFLSTLRQRFRAIHDADITIEQFMQGSIDYEPIEVNIISDDLPEIKRLSRQVEAIMRDMPGLNNVKNEIGRQKSDLKFDINRGKASMLGIPVHEIDKTIRCMITGLAVSSYRDANSDQYDIVLRGEFGGDMRLEDFDVVTVRSLSGALIPLKQVATPHFVSGPDVIMHEHTQRVAKVTSGIAEGYTLEERLEALRRELQTVDFGDARYEFLGEKEEKKLAFANLGSAALLAVLFIFIVLLWQFRSFFQPLIVFTALPLAAIGSFYMLWLVGESFSFMAFVGLISLIGIAVNNSIMLVEFANQQRAGGMELKEAAETAAQIRLTPVLLTTLTTIFGLLPLTLFGGAMWLPMGFTIIGGLLTSAFFVLLIVPVLYIKLSRFSIGNLNEINNSNE